MAPRGGTAQAWVVGLLVAVLAGYLGLIAWRGVFLLGRPGWTLRLLGLAVLTLPVLGIWAVAAELRFGRATQRLARQLPPDLAESELPRRASGRIEPAAAAALFESRRAAVETDATDWRGWYRLAVAYDLGGDRRRARAAMRTAIERHTATATSS